MRRGGALASTESLLASAKYWSAKQLGRTWQAIGVRPDQTRFLTYIVRRWRGTNTCLDYDDADLAVLIGGRDYRIYHLPRDRGLEQLIVGAAAKFWIEHVCKKIPPDPICDRDLGTLYAVDNGEALDVTGDDDTISAVERLADINAQIKSLEASKKDVRAQIAGKNEGR